MKCTGASPVFLVCVEIFWWWIGGIVLNGNIIDTSWKKSPYTFSCPLDSLMLIIAVDESIWLATSMTDMLALRKLNTKGAAYLFSQDDKNRTITVTHTSGSDVRLLIIQKNKK